MKIYSISHTGVSTELIDQGFTYATSIGAVFKFAVHCLRKDWGM
jgi:hypothetical protein